MQLRASSGAYSGLISKYCLSVPLFLYGTAFPAQFQNAFSEHFPKGVSMHRVLIVDDESLIADTLGLIFRKNGFEAKVVYTADDALQCARSFAPELLLCDINMPVRSGLELMGDFSRE